MTITMSPYEAGILAFGLTAISYRLVCTEREKLELAKAATTDSLTGLVNRAGFEARLHTEFLTTGRYKRPLSLLLIDLDGFKRQDAFGHAAGDRTLEAIGLTIKRTVRVTDITARYGGDEFAVLMPFTPAEKALALAERALAAIAATPTPIGTVTASIGVATADFAMQHASALIEKADMALYRAKANGRNLVVQAGSMPVMASI